jgi:hypothetical protein
MIVRRIQAIQPPEEHTEGEKNNRRVQDSTHGHAGAQSARIKVVRQEDQNGKKIGAQSDGHENALIQLRRIYPHSPRL